MVEKLKLSTRVSLFEPVIVEIDGRDYECVKFTRPIMEKFLEFEKRVEAARKKASPGEISKLTYEILTTLFSVDGKVLDKLDGRELQEIVNFLVMKLSAARKIEPKVEGKETEEEKKVEKPGDKS